MASRFNFLSNSIVLDLSKGVNDSIVISGLLRSTENLDNILVLVTDAAAYMHKGAELLLTYHTKMIHNTCLTHAIQSYREIRTNFSHANTVISFIEKVFVNAPSQISAFRGTFPKHHSHHSQTSPHNTWY